MALRRHRRDARSGARGGGRRRRSLLALLARAHCGPQALGLRAVRLDGGLAHGPPTRVAPTPPCSSSHEAGGGDRGLDRRQRAPRRLRSLRRHDRGGARVRAEPRLRRRRAARAHQLPQLRQPGEADVAWQLDRSTQALADACNALAVPVVGGNVSLYNETDQGPIYPTPVVGMVGELPDPERAGGLAAAAGDAIAICGPFSPSLAGSELAKLRGELGAGLPSLPIDSVAARSKRCARRCARASCAPPTTSATAGSPARWPRSRSPAASGSTPTSTRWSRLAAARARRRCSARDPAASCSPATAPGSRHWLAMASTVRGRRGGRRPDHALGGGRGGRRRPHRRRARLALAR